MCLALGGCGGKPQLVGGPEVQVLDRTTLPVPQLDDAGFRLGALDKLNIELAGMADMQREVQVDAAGNVSFPMAGQVRAAGKTPDELARQLEERLRQNFVRQPQITVNLKETNSRTITVEGAVREPGIYPMLGDMTLMRSVASAKGLTDTASSDHVVVFRTIGTQRYAALYSLRAIREGVYADPALYPNDILVIGESAARRTFRDVLQTAPLLLAPVVALLQGGSL